MSTIQIEKRDEHPLFNRKVHPILCWEEFLELWEKSVTYEELTGLLHAGFNIWPGEMSKKDKIDQLVFYFTVADSYDREINFRPFGEHFHHYRFGPDKDGCYSEKSSSEMCKLLAKKAFNMLCLNFFKIKGTFKEFEESVDTRDWWQNDIVNDEILPIIFKFFLNKKNSGELEVCNISHHSGEWPHPEKHLLDFLLGLTDFLFQWEKDEIGTWYWENEKEESERREKANSEMQELIFFARPLIIEILNRIKKLGFLEKHILKLDETSILKLTEIALREELSKYSHPVDEDRKVATIEEAIFVGSAAALLVKKHEIMTKEKEKWGIILENKNAIKIAQQKIAEIRSE